MSGGAAEADARGGRTRPAGRAPGPEIPPDWAELLDRLDRLERGRAEARTNEAKGEGR